MKKYLIILALVGVATTSCYEKLNITPPNNIVDEQIEELLNSGDETQIQLVLGGMANAMPEEYRENVTGSETRYSNTEGLQYMRNLEGNDIVFGNLVNSSTFGTLEYMLGDFITSATDKNYPYWKIAWDRIHPANKLLAYVPADKVGNSNLMKEYRARALFIRAHGYLLLMQDYRPAMSQGNTKGMPLYTEWNPTQEYAEYASAEATWNFILTDLKEAVQLLKEAGIGVTKDNLQDIDLAVVNYELARAALYAEDYATCISACNEVLSAYNTFMSEEQYVAQSINGYDANGLPARGEDGLVWFYAENSGFLCLAQNPEAILGWGTDKSIKTADGWLNIFSTGNGGEGSCFARIDDRLYDLIDPRDYRGDNFMVQALGNHTYPFTGNQTNIQTYSNLKFANTVGIDGTTNENPRETVGNVDEIDIRMSEVLLMKAEAEAQSGSGDAKATLNLLLAARTRAGEPTMTCDNYASMAGMTPLQMVQLQFRIEMWGEKGLEYYNNKRWGIAVDRASSNVHWSKGNYPVANMVCQLPLNEVQYNPYASAAQN